MRKGPKTHYFNQTLVLKIKEKILNVRSPEEFAFIADYVLTFTFDTIYKQRVPVRKHRPTIILMEEVQGTKVFSANSGYL